MTEDETDYDTPLRSLEHMTEDETDCDTPLRGLEHVTVDHMEMFECDDSDSSGNSVPDKTNYNTPLRSLEHMTEDETDYDTPLRGLERMTVDHMEMFECDDSDGSGNSVPELSETQALECVLESMQELQDMCSVVPVTTKRTRHGQLTSAREI
eukprot:gene20203-26948_t